MLGRPELDRPILVAAFRGWNDGGQGATLAAGYLARLWNAEKFAEIDPEGFLDFQSTRPHVSLDEGLTRRIEWPENAFYWTRAGGARDVVLLLGVEPTLRWRTFCGLVIDLARDLDVQLAVTLGSLLADVPHTRAAPVTGAASDPKLVADLGLQHSRYEGPTGIVGVLGDATRACPPRACGRPCLTTSRLRRARARRAPCATAWARFSTSPSTRRSCPRPRRRTPRR